MSRTYAILKVSSEAYSEIKQKLESAGYDHAVHGDVIDMHGIALEEEKMTEEMMEHLYSKEEIPRIFYGGED